MSEHRSRPEAIDKLAELIRDIRVCMLTTAADADGTLRSRPMVTQDEAFDGTLWFFTGAASGKVDEIRRDQHVNLAYADPSHDRYVSVSGRANVVRDRDRIDRMWKPLYKAWFPQGKDDPDVALLHVTVDRAEYWDPTSSRMVQVAGFIKATLTGQPADGGENQKIDFLGEVH